MHLRKHDNLSYTYYYGYHVDNKLQDDPYIRVSVIYTGA